MGSQTHSSRASARAEGASPLMVLRAGELMRLVDYDPRWVCLFEDWAAEPELHQRRSSEWVIEHIGSTAIGYLRGGGWRDR